jgi:hypothetical protein
VFGAHIFIVPISQFLSPKLKKRRVFRKKKSRKKERKIGRTSFKFFQLILSLFSIKRNLKGKGSGKNRSPILLHPPHSHFPNTKKRAKILLKTEEKKQKERKKRRKRREKEEKKKGSLILISCSHFP